MHSPGRSLGKRLAASQVVAAAGTPVRPARQERALLQALAVLVRQETVAPVRLERAALVRLERAVRPLAVAELYPSPEASDSAGPPASTLASLDWAPCRRLARVVLARVRPTRAPRARPAVAWVPMRAMVQARA